MATGKETKTSSAPAKESVSPKNIAYQVFGILLGVGLIILFVVMFIRGR